MDKSYGYMVRAGRRPLHGKVYKYRSDAENIARSYNVFRPIPKNSWDVVGVDTGVPEDWHVVKVSFIPYYGDVDPEYNNEGDKE